MKRVWPLLATASDPFDDWTGPALTRLEPGGAEDGDPECGEVPTLEQMVRIGVDVEPDLGELGPDSFLGPWADALDARVPEHRHALAMATAAAAFAVGNGRSRPPYADWARRQPRPDTKTRDALRAIDRSAYRVVAPETAPHAAWFFPGRPGTVLARVVRGPTGVVAPLAFAFPAGTPFDRVLRAATTRCAAASPHLDPLRRGGQAWIRYAYEWPYAFSG